MGVRALGNRGERLAAQRLRDGGWTVLHRNVRLGPREIDLVARRGEVVAFVEVKTRSDPTFGHPLAAITARKRALLRAAATRWIALHGRPDDVYRFDAVSVLLRPGRAPEVEHVEDAWW